MLHAAGAVCFLIKTCEILCKEWKIGLGYAIIKDRYGDRERVGDVLFECWAGGDMPCYTINCK